MATFWAIVIGALFVISVGVLVFLGARTHRSGSRQPGEELPSSRNKHARDRREASLERDEEQTEARAYEGRTRVYRH